MLDPDFQQKFLSKMFNSRHGLYIPLDRLGVKFHINFVLRTLSRVRDKTQSLKCDDASFSTCIEDIREMKILHKSKNITVKLDVQIPYSQNVILLGEQALE